MCDSCGGLWCSPLLWGWWCAIHVGACGVRFLWGLVLCDFLWGLGVCDSLWEFVVCDSCGGLVVRRSCEGLVIVEPGACVILVGACGVDSSRGLGCVIHVVACGM